MTTELIRSLEAMTLGGSSLTFQSEFNTLQYPNDVRMCLERKILGALRRFWIFFWWVLLIILSLLPLSYTTLRPLWRIICWIAPTLLAVEVDAGNRTWVYVLKIIVWVFQVSFAHILLTATNAFQGIGEILPRAGAFIGIGIFLFSVSCILSLIGRTQKETIWFRGDPVRVGNRLRSIDKTVYVNLRQSLVKTKLTALNVKDAWVSSTDIEAYHRPLTDEEVAHHVIRTSLVTQFVVARVFKDVNNRVFVYCPVVHYRTVLITVALALAGIFHVLRELFQGGEAKDIVTTMILWATLPSITFPALVRMKFGNRIMLGYLLRGLLPVETDEDMWKRIGISAYDLYTALSNAFSAEAVFKDILGLTDRRGTGTVRVNNVKEAKGLCVKSMLRIGSNYVRVSDGERFGFFEPRNLKNLSALECELNVRFPNYRRNFESQENLEVSHDEESNGSGSETETSLAAGQESDSIRPVEFFLDPRTRVLRVD